MSKNSIVEAIKYFALLLNNNYPHVKPGRDNEYAHVNDYKSRYLDTLSSNDIESVLLSTFNGLEYEHRIVNYFFWLADAYYPDFKYKANEYIDSGLVFNNVGALKARAKRKHS